MNRISHVISLMFFVAVAKSSDSFFSTSHYNVHFVRNFPLFLHSPILHNSKLLPVSFLWKKFSNMPLRDVSRKDAEKLHHKKTFCTKLCHGFDKQISATESNHVVQMQETLPYKDRLMEIGVVFRNIFVAYLLVMTNTLSVSAVPESDRAIAIESAPKLEFANQRVIEEKVQIFQEILHDLDVSFVDPVDINKLAETGFNAMLNSLDPYTEFETPKAAKELRTQTSGNYGGVGLVVGRVLRGATESDVDPYPYVIKALEGFAFDAGIRVGVRPYPALLAPAADR
jgi:hypothetical protein